VCKENREYFLLLLVGVLLSFIAGVLRAGEQEAWYLISEAELSSIEEYRTKSEAEKRIWLLQVQGLKTQSAGLRRESESLNSQLASQREKTRMLQQSFNEYEAENLMTISTKNGEIAGLKQTAAEEALEAAKHKGVSQRRLIISIALGGAWIVFIAFKICRFFRIF
jgi:hypothetical protein